MCNVCMCITYMFDSIGGSVVSYLSNSFAGTPILIYKINTDITNYSRDR